MAGNVTVLSVEKDTNRVIAESQAMRRAVKKQVSLNDPFHLIHSWWPEVLVKAHGWHLSGIRG
jgi:hypothetical protein